MRCLVASVVAALCLPACMGSMPNAHQDSAALRDELTTLEKQSWVAWQKRDGAFFASFLAEDHVEIGSQGPAGKAAIVAFVGSPACAVENYDVDHFSATRIARDTALLVYHARQKTTCGGAAVPSPVWASSLYVYRDGRWQNAAYQQSPTNQ